MNTHLQKVEAALQWYANQTALCRLIHSEGDFGRHALDADGGKKAREALHALAYIEAEQADTFNNTKTACRQMVGCWGTDDNGPMGDDDDGDYASGWYSAIAHAQLQIDALQWPLFSKGVDDAK